MESYFSSYLKISEVNKEQEMSQNEVKKYLYIHIIESPSSDDLLLKRQEGEILSNTLKLMGIKSQYFLAVNKDSLGKALLTIGLSHLDSSPSIPIIHFSVHGGSGGVRLTTGDFLTWNDLEKVLTPINKALNGFLVLCMSSCKGLNAVSMAFKEGGDLPFFVLVANSSDPTWPETLVGFTTFYHLLGKGVEFDKAVEAAGMASGNQHFQIMYGATVKKVWEVWNELLKEENLKKFIHQLSTIIEGKGEVK